MAKRLLSLSYSSSRRAAAPAAGRAPPAATPAENRSAGRGDAPSPPAATTAAAPAPEPPKATGPTPVVRYTEGIATPESVLYDEANDRYLVSNINGKPTDLDNNGYITELFRRTAKSSSRSSSRAASTT